MPYKHDADKRKWYRNKMTKEGYGKLLWQRRRVVYLNEREFREVLESITGVMEADIARKWAKDALRDAEMREEGLWLTKRQKGRMEE